MKRKMRTYVLVGLLILLIGIGLLLGHQASNLFTGSRVNGLREGESRVESQPSGTNANSQVSNEKEQAGAEKSDAYVGEFRVERVIDGDTIEIAGGERVRYIGMDTPESVTPGKPVECFGKEASEENRRLVEGKTVRLEKDTTERDQYGRLLRYVYAGNTFVNLQLVAQGYARTDAYPPDIRYQDRITAAKDAAKNAGLGLWRACGKKSPSGRSSL
ncbi:MAG: thermonuclease family protein [Candidatus Moraniibacteriota bacterium]